jgi:NTP pyrophosphatase (non-canonical NTP hydrolase)
MKQIQVLLDDIGVWSTKTFPNQTSISKLCHLTKEVEELKEAIAKKHSREEKALEFADCFTLLFDSARIEGFNASDIKEAMEAKYEINKNRKWGVPDENGVIHHVKDEPLQKAKEQSGFSQNCQLGYDPYNHWMR